MTDSGSFTGFCFPSETPKVLFFERALLQPFMLEPLEEILESVEYEKHP